MKKFFTLIAAMLMLSASAGTLTLYNYDSETYFVPLNSMWFDTPGTEVQVLYPAADLTAMVGKEIKAITFYTDEDGVKMDGGTLELYMGETELTALTDYVQDLTLVGTVDISKQEGEAVALTLTFDTPYLYNGGNLVFGNIVKTAGNTTMTYFGGEATNYNNCVHIGAGNVKTLKQFLPQTTFTYEGASEDEGIVNLKQANALEDNAEFTFNGNAVVTVCKNGYLFLRDESGYGMIAGTDATFENGQVLNTGWNATKTSVNNGWVRYINAAGLSDSGETNAELAAAQVLTTRPDESMINAFVVIENTVLSNGNGTFPGLPIRNYTLPDNSTITKTEILWGLDGDAGNDPFNVYGIICKVSGKLMIQPVAFEPYVAPEPTYLRGDVDDSGVVNIGDVTALIKYLLGGDASLINPLAADCDESGEIKIGDVTALINYLLAGSWD